jgi:hypothetical protein
MDTSKLKAKLLEEAQIEVPPFGAESVEMARTYGPEATPLLLDLLHGDEKAAFLALEALRAADEKTYDSLDPQLRAKIYSRALAGNASYNAWGLPAYHLTDTAKAFIGVGQDAIPMLLPLLSDRREAMLEGSQDATTGKMYHNRVRDYAWVLMNEILGRPYTYARDPEDRDRSISNLLRELDRNAGK